MLEQLTLRNFQRHAHLSIQLDQQVAIICGKTDCGKSAVIRALRWACLNRSIPKLTRHGADKASAVLLLDDGRKVIRRTGKGGNVYLLDGERLQLERGGAVPSQVAALLNVGSDNFSRQHDPTFLFTDTAGAVAKRLNAVVDLGLIDRTATAAAATVRQTRAEVEVCRRRLSAAKERRNALAWVPEAQVMLLRMEEVEQRLAEKRLQASRLSDLATRRTNAFLAAQNAANARLALVKGITAAERALQKRRQYDRLLYLSNSLVKIGKLAKLGNPLEAFAKVEAAAKKVAALGERAMRLEALHHRLENTLQEVAELTEVAAAKADEVSEAMQGQCPLCGRG